MGVITGAAVLEKLPITEAAEAAPAVEESGPDFVTRLKHCAQRLRSGEIREMRDLQETWFLAGQIGQYGHDVDGPFVGPAGEPLYTPDAELVWSRRSLEAWMFDDDETKELARVADSFRGKESELDADIPTDTLGQVLEDREWLGRTLGISNPYRFSLNELSQMASSRLGLSNEAATVRSETLYPLTTLVSVTGTLATRVVAGLQVPKPRASGDQEERRPFVMPVPTGRERVGGMEPFLPYSGVVRSHRRVMEWPVRLKQVAAVTALVMTGAAALLFGSTQKFSQSPEARAVLKMPEAVTQAVIPELLPSEANHLEPPPAPADRIMTPGANYDPVARTGAIQFMVEDYAAELGHPKLTLLQAYLLTDRTLKYMNERMSGGMSWSRAEEISADTQLPFPPANTMRIWIAEVAGTTPA